MNRQRSNPWYYLLPLLALLALNISVYFYGYRQGLQDCAPAAPIIITHEEKHPLAPAPFTVDSTKNNNPRRRYRTTAVRQVPSGSITAEITAPCPPDTIKLGADLSSTDTIQLPSAPALPPQQRLLLSAAVLSGPDILAPGLETTFRNFASAGAYYDPQRRRWYIRASWPLLITHKKRRP